jgi:hypothetical protein
LFVDKKDPIIFVYDSDELKRVTSPILAKSQPAHFFSRSLFVNFAIFNLILDIFHSTAE